MLDLHVHLRGTITPRVARHMAYRNGIEIPEDVFSASSYAWTNFSSFLKTYDVVTSVIATATDLEEVAYDYLVSVAAMGGKYVEFMLSPPDLMRSGISFYDQLSALTGARERARDETGIECRMIATAVRHLGPEAALNAARIAVDRKSDILVGFGLTGDERQFSVKQFAEPFRIARSEGLLATAHAGEHLGPETIIEAVEELSLQRIGHGVRAVESESVMRQIAKAGIPLEVCLSSNLALGLYRDLTSHPIGKLVSAGCIVTLGTDDPTFFGADLRGEYNMAQRALVGIRPVSSVTSWAIDGSFCDEATKAKLRRNIRELDNDVLTSA